MTELGDAKDRVRRPNIPGIGMSQNDRMGEKF